MTDEGELKEGHLTEMLWIFLAKFQNSCVAVLMGSRNISSVCVCAFTDLCACTGLSSDR